MPRDYDAFISYTRQQGASLAEVVLELLRGQDFKVWQDRTHMRGGEDFWRQIEAAIEHAHYLIMVLTPDAFEGDREFYEVSG
jgi:TIR domain